MINLLDRYILKQFVLTLIFAVLALCLIFIIVNLLESLDKFLDMNVSTLVIAQYYLYYLPEIMQILLPIATLVATLFTIGGLSTLNEITAMKSGGRSLYRLMLPWLLFTFLLSFGHLWFNGWVVPVANQYKHEIESQYLNKSQKGGTIYNLFFRDAPTRNLVIQYYDSKQKMAGIVSVEEYTSEDKPRLKKRYEAEQMTWDDSTKQWIMSNVIVREYFNPLVQTQKYPEYPIKLNLSNTQIEQLKKNDKEMNLDERQNYINLLQQGGKDVRVLSITYYGDYAFPFANLIVILFGVPFASVRRKGGIAIQIAAAMIISFSYMIFTKVSQVLGNSMSFHPILAGWIANIIFFFVGLITIFRTKT